MNHQADGGGRRDPEALRSIEARLMAPGAPFELVDVTVGGRPYREWRHRADSLRDVLLGGLRHADAVHLVHGDRRWTFTETVADAAGVAAGLRSLGVGPGDRVALLAANCPEWLIGFWATVSLGAVVVGMNGWWTADEIQFAMDDAEPVVVITDRQRAERLADVELPASVRSVVELGEQFEALAATPAEGLPTDPIDPDATAVILYTSGTTGRPKGAVSTHRMMTNNVHSIFFHGARVSAAGGSGPTTGAEGTQPSTILVYPLFHVSGLHAIAVPAPPAGMKLVFLDGRFDPARVLDTIARERVTTVAAVPTLLRRLLDHPGFAEADLSSVRSIGTGGAPSSPSHLARLSQAFPNARSKVGNGYGLTETCGFATSNYGSDVVERPGCVGRPLPIVEIEIHDPSGRPVPTGELGEVCFRGVTVLPGYWRRPEATAEAIDADGWFRSGDIGRMDEEGRVYLADRRNDMIIRGGENIYPIEIENRLVEHPAVVEAAVVGQPDEEFGEVVRAVVVLDPQRDAAAEDLAAWVGETLAPYKVPTVWDLRHEPLPRNPTGKVLKGVLRGTAQTSFIDTDW